MDSHKTQKLIISKTETFHVFETYDEPGSLKIEFTPKIQKIKNATPYGSLCKKILRHKMPQKKESQQISFSEI